MQTDWRPTNQPYNEHVYAYMAADHNEHMAARDGWMQAECVREEREATRCMMDHEVARWAAQ